MVLPLEKTLISTPPDIEILGEYLRDFLRGLFDGDGTICESFSNRNSKLATLYMGFAIAKQSMPWLHTVLTDIVGVTYKSFERENIYTITLNTNKSIQLLNFMYEDTTDRVAVDAILRLDKYSQIGVLILLEYLYFVKEDPPNLS